MRGTLTIVVAAIVLLCVPSPTRGQDAEKLYIAVTELEWAEIVPGVNFGTIYGGRFDQGPYGMLVRFDAGVASPPHKHSGAYRAVVLQGIVTNPLSADEEGPRMEVGHAWYVPAGAEHVTACVSEESCLFYVHADQAWDLTTVEW